MHRVKFHIYKYLLGYAYVHYLQMFGVVDQRQPHALYGDDQLCVDHLGLAYGVRATRQDWVVREQNHPLQPV